MNWKLSRGEPALPHSYFWTWDHSANWVLDDPGLLNFGCANRYLKRPETYVEDYRRLTDLAAALGVKGIVIWGFLRDSHGGVESAKRVADYAASKGVAVMPGVGLTWYGGVYYEGDHPFNLDTFLRKHAEARLVSETGQPMPSGEAGACPLHPAFQDWVQEGLDWLFREFNIGGVNLENGDFVVCHCPRCKEHRKSWPEADPDFFRMQALAYLPALEALKEHLPDKLITWATYTSFSFGLPLQFADDHWPYIGRHVPTLVERAPDQSIPQWTLSGVVHSPALPLTAYLDDGAPRAAFENQYWPVDLRAPAKRSVGFLHQGSQWTAMGPAGRYQQIVSTIKEGCLRAYRAGMEGVSIHGEVTSRYIPWALNYLAFSHFIHRPEDSLRDFGRTTLGRVLADEDEGEAFVEVLAHWDAHAASDVQVKEAQSRAKALRKSVSGGRADLDRLHFWDWLERMVTGRADAHTAGFF
ncbi:MAG TPA: hypothetical protein VMZ92_04895 [Planctomycetota bacterium]|nr:hypothetical protein [Planctomycetota bacterium]